MNERKELKLILLGLFVILFAIDILDIFSTVVGLHIGLSELNPIGVWMMKEFGQLWGLVIFKAFSLAVVAGVIVFVIYVTPTEFIDDEAAIGAMIFVIFLGIAVLSNNFSLIGYL